MVQEIDKALSFYAAEYTTINPESFVVPIVGINTGTPEVRLVTGDPKSLVWQAESKKYGLGKGKKLPPLPPNFLPLLFSDESRRNLTGATYAAFKETGAVIDAKPIVFGFNEEKSGRFFPWDAGLQIELNVEDQDIRLFGPAVVSFDHAISRLVGEGATNYLTFEYMTRAHLQQLRTSYFDLVAIHMPALKNDSATGGIFASDSGYKNISFKVGERPYDLQLLSGIHKIEDEPLISHSSYLKLANTEQFGRSMQIISEAWIKNFERERENWPAEYSDVSNRLSLEILDYINRDLRKTGLKT